MGELSDLVKEKPELYLQTKKEVYSENKNLFRFAKYADKWAKTFSLPSAGIDAITIAGVTGVVPAMAMDFIKKIPKLGFLAYYGAKTHDVVGTLGSLLYEAGSIVPFAGEILDFNEKYLKQSKKYAEKESQKRFKERFSLENQLLVA